MPLPTSGTISFGNIRTEMNAGTGSSYGAMPLNDGTFRSRLTNTAQNTQLALSELRGNAYQRFTIAGDTQYYNIRNALVATGWNGTAKGSADVIINGGIYVSSGSTGSYAMDTGGPWPGPSSIVLYNYGYIVGMGGGGGAGGVGRAPGAGGSTPGSPGGGGGPSLLIQRSTTLVNGGIIGGGGGGGGGGAGMWTVSNPLGGPAVSYAGGGGGGGQSGRTNSGGGAGGYYVGPGTSYQGAAGGAGTVSGAGAGGAGAVGATPPAAFTPQRINPGSAGGGWGAGGGAGDTSPAATTPASGGGAGVAIQGWSAVAGAPSGTIYGPVAG